jgi:membrane protease YdiL (CAAX protease family)
LKRGSKLGDYLGLTLPSARQFFFWLFVLLIFLAGSDGVSILLGKPTTPEFMVKTYTSLKSPLILWLALLVAAPLSEELFFRGFLIKGLSASVLKWYGAVLISSAMWAAIHIQYDVYGIATILVLGFILGAARVKSGSLILTILLHSLTNLLATAEVVIHLHNSVA